MIRFNLVNHRIVYVDGRINGRMQPLPPALAHFLGLFNALLQPLLSYLFPGFTNEWQCEVYRETFFELLDNQYDSGLYVSAVTYYFSIGVPLFFNRNSITRLRINLAYWMLVGKSPI